MKTLFGALLLLSGFGLVLYILYKSWQCLAAGLVAGAVVAAATKSVPQASQPLMVPARCPSRLPASIITRNRISRHYDYN